MTDTTYQITYNANGQGRYHISRVNAGTIGPGRWEPVCGSTADQRTDGRPRPTGTISETLDRWQRTIHEDLRHGKCWRAALKIEHPNGEPEPDEPEDRPPFAHRLQGPQEARHGDEPKLTPDPPPGLAAEARAARYARLATRRRTHLAAETRAEIEAARRRPPAPTDGRQQGEKVHRAASPPEDSQEGSR